MFTNASDINDIFLEPEVRLICALVRTDEEETRLKLLVENIEASGSVSLTYETRSMGSKIDGKKFFTALGKRIKEYGNVDEKFIIKDWRGVRGCRAQDL